MKEQFIYYLKDIILKVNSFCKKNKNIIYLFLFLLIVWRFYLMIGFFNTIALIYIGFFFGYIFNNKFKNKIESIIKTIKYLYKIYWEIPALTLKNDTIKNRKVFLEVLIFLVIIFTLYYIFEKIIKNLIESNFIIGKNKIDFKWLNILIKDFGIQPIVLTLFICGVLFINFIFKENNGLKKIVYNYRKTVIFLSGILGLGLFFFILEIEPIKTLIEKDRIKDLYSLLSISSLFVLYFLWYIRDENKKKDIDNNRRDINLKDFQVLSQWACGTNYSNTEKQTEKHYPIYINFNAHQLAAIAQLEVYLNAGFGKEFIEPSKIIISNLIKDYTNKIEHIFENNTETEEILIDKINKIKKDSIFILLNNIWNNNLKLQIENIYGLTITKIFEKIENDLFYFNNINSDIINCNVNNKKFQYCNFYKNNLKANIFIKTEFTEFKFLEANIINTKFIAKSKLNNCKFENSKFSNISFKDVTIENLQFYLNNEPFALNDIIYEKNKNLLIFENCKVNYLSFSKKNEDNNSKKNEDIFLIKLNILNSKFSFCVLNNFQVDLIKIYKITFNFSNFEKSKFVSNESNKLMIKNTIFKNVNFFQAEFKDVIFFDVTFNNIDFRDVKLTNCKFINLIILDENEKSNFSNTIIQEENILFLKVDTLKNYEHFEEIKSIQKDEEQLNNLTEKLNDLGMQII